jgi:hypothetical protein
VSGITRKQAEATIARLTDEERAMLKSLPDSERAVVFELMVRLDATLVEEERPQPPLPAPNDVQIGRYHHDGHDTELESAAAIATVAGRIRRAVVEHLRAVGERGATDYETWVAIEMGRYPHVVATRREELIEKGWPIIKTKERRPTNTGRNAIVWVLREGA